MKIKFIALILFTSSFIALFQLQSNIVETRSPKLKTEVGSNSNNENLMVNQSFYGVQSSKRQNKVSPDLWFAFIAIGGLSSIWIIKPLRQITFSRA